MDVELAFVTSGVGDAIPDHGAAMLSDEAVYFLRSLRYDPDAERLSCLIPMGGIYWEDEIPDFRTLMAIPEPERKLIYRLFSIRFKLWDSHGLDADDQRFWDAARYDVPECPIFRRTELSVEDHAAQDAVERDTIVGFEALVADADEVTFSDDGSFSATFDLTKDQREPWWQRLVSWCFRS